MKYIYLFIILNLTSIGCIQNRSTECHEIITFEKHLKIIENYVVFDSLDLSVRRTGSVFFLENVTDIPSESDANFFGKMNPTRTDYLLWSNWFNEHKDSLCEMKYKVLIDSSTKLINE
ncbi:MAG: hypothetical protein KGZ71_07960 [Desulfobulbaceae bacterium]|nr:hypothetical protein [Desulfobulbaceae bacterium]